MSSGSSRRGAAPADAVLLFKVLPNPFHHGTLGIIRSLGRAGVPVFAAVEDAGSPAGWSRYLRGRFLWNPDPHDPERLVSGLRAMGCCIGGLPVLIPLDDPAAVLVAERASALGARFRLPRQPPELPRRLASKAELAVLCRELGVATPNAWVFASPGQLRAAEEGLTYPVVVKCTPPVENAGEAMVNSTTIVADRAQMSDYLARCGSWAALPLVVQEYLPEQDCEDWFFHGCVGENPRGDAAFRLSFTGRKIRSYPLGAGLTTMGRACDNPELRRVAEKFLVGVGYRGIVDLDVRLDRRTNAYHLLDANPRPGAQFAVARRADGIDAARALYLELTGRPLPPQVAQSSGHAICVENFDAVSVARLLLQRRLSPREWLRSMREGPVEWAWFDRDDLLPWIVMWSRFLWCRIVPRLMPRPSGPRAAGHTWPVQLNRLGRVRPVTAPDSTERPAAAPRIFDGSRRRLRTGAAVLLVRPDAGGACETRAPRRGVES